MVNPLKHIVIGAIICLAVASSALRSGRASASLPAATPDASVAAPGPLEILPIPPPGNVETVADLIGAYIYVREDRIVRAQIHELVWGITDEGAIGLAVLKAVEEDGQVIDYRKLELYQRLAFSPKELNNSFFEYQDGTRLGVEYISYRIDGEGMMETAVWKGDDRTGRPFLYDGTNALLYYLDGADVKGSDLAPIPVCCRSVEITECLPNPTCDGGMCPGPTNCACTGSGSCYLRKAPQCEGSCGGSCPPGSECAGQAPNCECVN